jgi:hypothetical protein
VTIRNLTQCFRPRSVAIVGASERAGSVGAIVLDNVRRSGFGGAVFPINPKHEWIGGLKCYAKPADLPQAPGWGALRLRTIATKDQGCEAFPDKLPDGNFLPSVILELDHWVVVPAV